jgi:DNA-binding transcriptional MerR regulator
MQYSVQQLATLARVTPRTLRFYDKVGLLSPAGKAKNGYRYYGEKELVRLQQILFFRELEFPLDDIKRMMSRPGFDPAAALLDQKKLLQLKRGRLTRLIHSIEKTITHMANNHQADHEELYDAFKDDDVQQYQAEVKERWGGTAAHKQSQARVAKLTKAEMAAFKAKGEALTRRLADAMTLDPASPEAQKLIAEHHAGIEFFYECQPAMYRNLGQMYVDDPRFTAYYDKVKPGLAAWVQRGINRWCDVREAQAK